MLAGLPATTWLLILAAVGAGLVIELAFFRAQRGRGVTPARTADPRSDQRGGAVDASGAADASGASDARDAERAP